MSTDTRNRHVVVFVHGFGSSKRCWTRGQKQTTGASAKGKVSLIGDLMADDPAFADTDIDYFEYDTRWFNFRPLRRIPNIAEIGQGLRAWLEAMGYHQRPVTLIGHSQGGLVILSYLHNVIGEKEAPTLRNVRQVVMIATPQKGSKVLLGARGIIGRLFPNAQERRLRPLNESVDQMLADLTRDILDADTRNERDRWPVRIRSFYGSEDGVVNKESARGELDPGAVDALKGDHFTVIQPINSDDARYRAVKGAVQRPIGHKHVLVIDRYRTTIAVAPKDENVTLDFGKRSNQVTVRSECQLNRAVMFSDSNVCEKPLEIRYRTLATDGFLKHASGGTANRGEIAASDLQEYRDDGDRIRFLYRPRRRASDECYLNLRVFNGFNSGNTNAHFHLHPRGEPMRSIETLEYLVDLSQYVARGMTIEEPTLYLHRHNPAACDELCGSRTEEDRRAPSVSDPVGGVWQWELHDVEGGVVDVFWDFHPGLAATPVADAGGPADTT